jgi:hypothetical protein
MTEVSGIKLSLIHTDGGTQATIQPGTRRDAILHAAGANADHGLRRSNDDKRRAVQMLLQDEEWGRWSDREIARRCKVSHPLAAKLRAELAADTGNITSERVYVDRHGNETVMETANIGTKNEAEPAPFLDVTITHPPLPPCPLCNAELQVYMLKGTQEKYILKARCDCKYEVTYVHRPDYPFASSYSNEAALRNERDGGAGAARARTVSDCIIGFQKLRDRLGDEFDKILEVPTKAMRYLPDMDPERKWTIDIVEEALETMRPTAQPPTPDPQPEPAIHCKDRARVGRYSKHGVFSMDPFSDEVARRFRQHGFIQLARITITTDVVRENNQTYRLGWSEMLKDGSKMGVGMPEYIQVFRKLPSDRSNAYADEPVTKERADYSLGRWQVDAHQYWRSNGNRLLRPEEVAALDIKAARRLVVEEQKNGHYDYERHVAICEALDKTHKLPRTFNLIPAQSNSDFVWSDVVYARTLNTSQSQKRQQHHVCPLPLDIVERCLERWSNEDDLVYDPFAGLFTVPYLAITLKRRGYGCELNSDYWATGVGYCRDAETEAMTPTLFDWLEELVEVAV